MAFRVLVVEDDPVNLELITALLEREGCQVLTAETAEAGLRLAVAENPDLVLMDVQLPGMTGYEAVGRLKGDPATRRIPVIALTAQAMRGEKDKACAAGCDDFLTKLIDFESLRAALGRFRGQDRPSPGGGPAPARDKRPRGQ